MILDKLKEILKSVLSEDSVTDINSNTMLKDINGWDSIEHMYILTQIEKEFKIKFELSEIVSLKTIGELVKVIENKVK